ncbi:hypothetical protein BJ912DRAFT_1001974 [Pholiota molesta]|nr:hypothetical protein BJ912DRAFT_1001974 [Pholiota molesta]
MELHLPALRTLALSTRGQKAWAAPSALSELSTALASAPGITALALEERPMWTHTPHLAHLQFNFPNGILMGAATHDASARVLRARYLRHVAGYPERGCPLRVMRICAKGVVGRERAGGAAWASAWAGDAPRVALEIAEMSLFWGARFDPRGCLT